MSANEYKKIWAETNERKRWDLGVSEAALVDNTAHIVHWVVKIRPYLSNFNHSPNQFSVHEFWVQSK